MNPETHSKVQARHLKRNAYLYVRQSTLRQVFENTESTKRQYGLRQRAVAMGWAVDQVIVIDSDLGQSGASAVRGRRLVAQSVIRAARPESQDAAPGLSDARASGRIGEC